MVFQDCKSALCPMRTVGAQMYEAVSEHERVSRAEVENRAAVLMEKNRTYRLCPCSWKLSL